MRVRFKKLRPEASAPEAATPMSAGYDLRAAVSSDVVIAPGSWAKIPTGIAVEPEREDVVGLVYSRSGLGAKYGVVVRNGVGVIDADYRGEIMVTLFNGGDEDFTVSPGDRIAQLVFTPKLTAEFEEAEELGETERGDGGFGHSGRR